MARMVATKAALSIRVDALSDAESRSDAQAAEVGISNRVKLESRLRALEHRAGIQSVRKVVSAAPNGRQQPKFEMSASGAGQYNSATDSVPLGSVSDLLPTQPSSSVAAAVEAVLEVKEEKRKEKKRREEGDDTTPGSSKKDKKKEKRKSEAADGDVTMDVDGREETKEERRARKEAKKAVSRSNHPMDRPLIQPGQGSQERRRRARDTQQGGEEVEEATCRRRCRQHTSSRRGEEEEEEEGVGGRHSALVHSLPFDLFI